MSDPQSVLAGRIVLVVEDEYLIASELAALLTEHGAKVLGPVPSVARARRVLATAGLPDMAMLDVNLAGDFVWPIAEILTQAGIPMVLATGYDAGFIPARFGHLPRCEKPARPDAVLDLLTRAVTGRHAPEP